ncbi:MAG: PEP-CTERM sorting domain-containing protein [Planctomycetota bacterium]
MVFLPGAKLPTSTATATSTSATGHASRSCSAAEPCCFGPPQDFQPTTLTVVPEPASPALFTLLAGTALGMRRRPHRTP